MCSVPTFSSHTGAPTATQRNATRASVRLLRAVAALRCCGGGAAVRFGAAAAVLRFGSVRGAADPPPASAAGQCA